VDGITRWTSVKNLTFSAEVMYTRLDQNFTSSATLTPTAPEADRRLPGHGDAQRSTFAFR
jgi:hypothetical protein